jgi:citrate lyase subunit beta/citryl-CoA lyase
LKAEATTVADPADKATPARRNKRSAAPAAPGGASLLPADVLFQGKRQPLMLPACDHYAGSDKLMRKSMALQSDLGPIFDITFDCEDGAATGEEAAHARLVTELLNSSANRFGRIGARVHDPRSSHFANDVATIVGGAAGKLAYLVIPKVESLQDVKKVIEFVNRHAQAAGHMAPIPIHVLIETHGALHAAWDIAALPQVECLSFGIMDFVSAHYGAVPASAMRTPGQFVHPLVVRAKLDMVAACHAHGKVPSHNVTTDIRDTAVVANDATRAAGEFGFTRMWSIHPDQVKPIVKAFTPRLSEVNEAAAILHEAMQANWGPISQHGRLHDRASYRYYWTVLQRARLAGLALPDTAGSLLSPAPLVSTPHTESI